VPDEFQGCEMAEAGDVFFVEDLLDEGAEIGREEGLDVLWGHEEAGIHVFFVFREGRADGVEWW